MYDPLRQELFTTSRGDGAQLDGKRIRVSSHVGLDRALIGTGFPYRANMQYLDNYMAMMKVVMQATAGIRRPGAAALDLAYVAAGRLDAFWEFGLSPWDTAAGTLLITEAGGMVGTLTGGEYKHQGHILAGSPKVYAALLETLAPMFRSRCAPEGFAERRGRAFAFARVLRYSSPHRRTGAFRE